MDIQGVGGVGGPVSKTTKRLQQADKTTSGETDRVEISGAAKEAQGLNEIFQITKSAPEIRTEVVEAARKALAEGTLVNPESIRLAAEKILKEI